MSFPVPVKYNLTAEKNNTVVVYNNGDELDLLPVPRCISESDMILGGTLKFNQLVRNGNFSESTQYWTNIGQRPMSVKNNILTIEINSFDTHFGLNSTISPAIVANHVYAIFAQINTSFDLGGAYLALRLGSLATLKYLSIIPSEFNNIGTIVKNSNITNSTLSLFIDRSRLSDGFISLKNIMLFDITDIFGENLANCIFNMETQTPGSGIEFIRTLFSGAYYNYDSGTNYKMALIPDSI